MVDAESRPTGEGGSRPAARTLIPALGAHLTTYLVSGALTAAIYYGILVLALLGFETRVPYLCLILAGHFATVVLVYPWYRMVVFRGSVESWFIGYLRFYAVGVGFLVLSLVGLPVLTNVAGLSILAAQGVIILVSPPLNYAFHRTWTFRERSRECSADMSYAPRWR